MRLDPRPALPHGAVTGAVSRWRNGRGDEHADSIAEELMSAMTQQRIAPTAGFALVTSRASYELVQKAASAGSTLLAAVSAPTALAIAPADSAGFTLIGFARPQGCAVYTHAQRFRGATGTPS